jgi:hypothetical protein
MIDHRSRRGMPGVLRSTAGLLLLFAVLLPLQIRRAGLEGYWWVDENESVLLASGPVARIFDYAASDTNPPGYFLALKPWLALGRSLPGERGVLWARLPATLAWALLATFLWFEGRRRFGPVAGAAVTWAVCASAYTDWFIHARGFGISSACVLACGLLLFGRIADAAADPPCPPGSVGPWVAYALCAEAAMWTHLTSLIALGMLGGIWLVAALRLRARAPRLLLAGGVAHAAAVLAFLPWLVHLCEQVAARRNEDDWWVTPATLKQWLLVFFRWYPFGDTELPRAVWLSLGILTLAIPLAAALAAWRWRGRPGPAATRGLAVGAGLALAFAVVFTSILWSLQRFLGLSVFHGPRYPCLALGVWALGLALLAAWATARAGWPRGTVWLLLAPWLLAGAIDLVDDAALLRPPTAVFTRPRQLLSMPRPGATLFVLPAALAPFTRQGLAHWRVRPAGELPCALAAMQRSDDVWVLDLNFLNMLDEVNDTVLIAAVGENVLANKVTAHQIPPPQYYTLYHLRGLRIGQARKLCAEGVKPAAPPIPANAAAVALPQPQRLRDGWWWPEVDPDLSYRRWWNRPRVRLTFDRAVPAGEYVLHYRGFCPGHEKEPAELRLRLEGTRLDVRLAHRMGEVAVDVPVHLDGPARVPVLELAHTMESTDAIGRGDMPVNFVGSTLRYAWLERR